ncbi:sensor histidine kinase [Chloroflexota bacterium]
MLYLIPIAWTGFLYGWKGGVAISFLALAGMILRVVIHSSAQVDAFLETSIIFVVGNIMVLTFHTLRKERRYRKQLEEAQEKLRFYLRQVNNAQEEERKRISHELHDDTIQSLVIISRKLDALASNEKELSEEHRQRLEELRKQTNDIMIGVRRLSQDLRPAALDRLGLIAAIEWLVEGITKNSEIQIKTTVNGNVARLAVEKELVIFRIVQETLRNIWRHSQASEAKINIEFDKGKIRITISDNGQGFEISKSMSNLPTSGKLGLAGMQERAQLINATLKLDSKVGEGTDIYIEVGI